MPFSYSSTFPIPAYLLPRTLSKLMEPATTSPLEKIEVASFSETDPEGENSEHLHLQMAVVTDGNETPIEIANESGNGVVEYSVPFGDRFGAEKNYFPSITGHDYIIASWGGGSHYTFNLAEKVWMMLGLTPRCLGNDEQRMIYDDLSLPEFCVAEGEISAKYEGHLYRNISWKMSNDYLRRYLWMRGARGIRVFYYSSYLDDHPELRALMKGKTHVLLSPDKGVKWYELDICEEENGRLLLQMWASVEAFTSEQCPPLSANNLVWPGYTESMTFDRANAMIGGDAVYLNDSFLDKYEQSTFYDTTPVKVYKRWECSPSYGGQWSFTDCRRLGRNLIKVSIRELYKPKPDREILHAFSHAVEPAELGNVDLNEEHIVAKVQKLLDTLLELGDGLSQLGVSVGLRSTPFETVRFCRAELDANGWLNYPELSRLAQVAPINMSQQMFLARCKRLYEMWQRIPDGFLKQLLGRAGCSRQQISSLRTIKPLQSLLNIVQKLNDEAETADAFISHEHPDGWDNRNDLMSPLFLNNDLRIADAHEAVGQCLEKLQQIGFDTSSINSGYGKALDYIFDRVTWSFQTFSDEIQRLLRPPSAPNTKLLGSDK